MREELLNHPLLKVGRFIWDQVEFYLLLATMPCIVILGILVMSQMMNSWVCSLVGVVTIYWTIKVSIMAMSKKKEEKSDESEETHITPGIY